jgi:hypothetical protein
MKIVALICRHEQTILVGSGPRKCRNTSIADSRNEARDIERKAETLLIEVRDRRRLVR